MSRWLSQVNNLLEKLDGTVETAVEEQLVRAEEEGLIAGQGKEAVDSILAKRGLDLSEEEEDDGLNDNIIPTEAQASVDVADYDIQKEAVIEDEEEVLTFGVEETKEEPVFKDEEEPEPEPAPMTENQDLVKLEEQPTDLNEKELSTQGQETKTNKSFEEHNAADAAPEQTVEVQAFEDPVEVEQSDAQPDISETPEPDSSVVPEELDSPVIVEDPTTTGPEEVSPPTEPVEQVKQSSSRGAKEPTRSTADAAALKKALADARAAQKEARTLRRHVVSLNSELESAEAEMQAQRLELEHAGKRMEKDRQRAKDEKERLLTRHKEEIQSLKKQNEQTQTEMKARHEKAVEESRKQLKEFESRRMQEDGDWSKELDNAVQREAQSRRMVTMLEDEKATLLAQLSTLQTQQDALESRLDSMTQSADAAMLREREAEDKLDAALSVHARQLSQRQSRESELERTIAELGAALAAGRNKPVPNSSSENHEVSGLNRSISSTQELGIYQDELETLRTQLEAERQRSETLQRELKDMSKERTEDLSAARTKQLEYDRKVAELSLSVSRLSKNLARKESTEDSMSFDARLGNDEKTRQLKELSEQLVRQQERLGASKHEVSTLKSRLQVALNRAEVAEAAQAAAEHAMDGYDVESGPTNSPYDAAAGLRKRRRKKPESVRSALMLTGAQNHNIERVGKAIDVLDSFSIQTGKFLRYNPFARGGFILYLLLLHLWTFVVLVFHAHNQPAHQEYHGPHALINQLNPELLELQRQLILQKSMEQQQAALPKIDAKVKGSSHSDPNIVEKTPAAEKSKNAVPVKANAANASPSTKNDSSNNAVPEQITAEKLE